MPVVNSETALYLDKPAEVERFLKEISGVKELALDTEGASFHRFLDRIYLLQISTRERNAIIDPLPIGSPPKLGELLENNAIEVVFHDADYDLRLLHQDYGWHVTSIFDTRVAAQLLGIKSFGLAALLEQFFDVKLDKNRREKAPLYLDGESVKGAVTVRPKDGRRLEHTGIKVQFIGLIGMP